MKTEYTEHKIEDVFRFFAEAFIPKEGKIVKWEATYDPRTGKVIFKLYMEGDK